MADELDNDDQWLYGDAPEIPGIQDEENSSESEPPPPAEEPAEEAEAEAAAPAEEEIVEKSEPEIPETVDDPGPPGVDDDYQEQEQDQEQEQENNDQNGDASDKEDSDEESDDDVNVVIGDIKTSPAYTSLNIKRGGLLSTTVDKTKQAPTQAGKFSVDEFDQMGMINGMQANEFNLDTLEDKPWRKPGADITDYFNYGFNEDTWKAYCERQKRLRVNESGVGLVPLNAIGLPRGPVPIMNDNSKYSGTFTGVRKAGPPPGRRMTGAIDVIGGTATTTTKIDAPKENVIQVMTADRREYSRKPPGFPDMSMPPPASFEEYQPEFGFNPEPEPFYGGYEPTQDVQWGGNQTWTPNEIKSLTPGPPASLTPSPLPSSAVNVVPPPMVSSRDHPPASTTPVPPAVSSRSKENTPVRESKDRESSKSHSEKPRDRDRERSHRRERSRSRSRRHKSRSRSPSHRHRKKKSRRHDDSD